MKQLSKEQRKMIERDCNEYLKRLRISSGSIDPRRDRDRRTGYIAAATRYLSSGGVKWVKASDRLPEKTWVRLFCRVKKFEGNIENQIMTWKYNKWILEYGDVDVVEWLDENAPGESGSSEDVEEIKALRHLVKCDQDEIDDLMTEHFELQSIQQQLKEAKDFIEKLKQDIEDQYEEEHRLKQQLAEKEEEIRYEIARCKFEAEKQRDAWGNGMQEHAIEARAMIMLCEHLTEFMSNSEQDIQVIDTTEADSSTTADYQKLIQENYDRIKGLVDGIKKVKENLSGWEDTDTMMGIAIKRIEQLLSPTKPQENLWQYYEADQNKLQSIQQQLAEKDKEIDRIEKRDIDNNTASAE